jgi:hypothetical protein
VPYALREDQEDETGKILTENGLAKAVNRRSAREFPENREFYVDKLSYLYDNVGLQFLTSLVSLLVGKTYIICGSEGHGEPQGQKGVSWIPGRFARFEGLNLNFTENCKGGTYEALGSLHARCRPGRGGCVDRVQATRPAREHGKP